MLLTKKQKIRIKFFLIKNYSYKISCKLLHWQTSKKSMNEMVVETYYLLGTSQ